MKTQPWIKSPFFDLLFIISPPFLCLLVIMAFPGVFAGQEKISDLSWLLLVLFVDVGHVYSTLYRTYFDPSMWKTQRPLLITIPLVSFVMAVMSYSIAPTLFWHILAYLAVFHFVRQQYGFMRIYSRHENYPRWSQNIDTACIYVSTIYPLLFWHLSGPRNFNWFVDGDFFYLPFEQLIPYLFAAYSILLLIWAIKELLFTIRNRILNIPKIGIITGTIFSWYFGIVYYNGDMAFTLLNVISHGIPYIALIWWYGNNNYLRKQTYPSPLRVLFSNKGLVFFISFLLIFAFIEEGLWDISVWKEHNNIFGVPAKWQLSLNGPVLAIMVGLLTIPQMTHYILDGFIWRKNSFGHKTHRP